MHLLMVYPTLHTLGGCWRLEGELLSESSPIEELLFSQDFSNPLKLHTHSLLLC